MPYSTQKLFLCLASLNLFMKLTLTKDVEFITGSAPSAKEKKLLEPKSTYFYADSKINAHLRASNFNYSEETSKQYCKAIIETIGSLVELQSVVYLSKPKKLFSDAWKKTVGVEGEATGLIYSLSEVEDYLLLNAALIGQQHFYCIVSRGLLEYESPRAGSSNHPNRPASEGKSDNSMDALFMSSEKNPLMAHTHFSLLHLGDVVIAGTESVRQRLSCQTMVEILQENENEGFDGNSLASELLMKSGAQLEDGAFVSVSLVSAESKQFIPDPRHDL